MAKSFTIAVDAMSGDHGVGICVPAALKALTELPQLRVLLVGDPATIAAALGSAADRLDGRLQVVAASQVVTMHEHPRDAVRHKKDSSMRVAINQVKRGDAQACVSAGNTGALMATAHFVLKTLPGIDRAAIISVIPAVGGHTYMLDLGANAGATAEQLLQFGVMGSIVAAELAGIVRPRIGLLNIGEEDIKGHEVVQAAHRLLQASALNYVGFVEGTDIFSGEIDVVVTDGFTGNVSLKSMEGLAALIGSTMKQEFTRNFARKLMGLCAWPALSAVRERFDPRRYNGASMVGLAGIVIKSHGGADELAFAQAIRTAVREAEQDVPRRIVDVLKAQATKGLPP
ncbi:MAG TPA: phosphate acyltransferase PlsX [Steroidobacteraceae bacterium]|nr:phosphate acyltransferase PlsX [Steroidobacteraceae bacterium]